jgi:hypothetical protein
MMMMIVRPYQLTGLRICSVYSACKGERLNSIVVDSRTGCTVHLSIESKPEFKDEKEIRRIRSASTWHARKSLSRLLGVNIDGSTINPSEGLGCLLSDPWTLSEECHHVQCFETVGRLALDDNRPLQPRRVQ